MIEDIIPLLLLLLPLVVSISILMYIKNFFLAFFVALFVNVIIFVLAVSFDPIVKQDGSAMFAYVFIVAPWQVISIVIGIAIRLIVKFIVQKRKVQTFSTK